MISGHHPVEGLLKAPLTNSGVHFSLKDIPKNFYFCCTFLPKNTYYNMGLYKKILHIFGQKQDPMILESR